MQIAHFSDPHVIDWSATHWRMFMNKRLTGGANFAIFRKKHHQRHVLEALIRDVSIAAPDHIVVTGDISSLAFSEEMRSFAALLEGECLDSNRVSVIPGNHDAYTRRSWTKRRALTELGRYATSDLGGGMPGFPFVRLRGPLAIIGLNSAVARPWFIASGLLGRSQLDVLSALLKAPQVRARYPVILIHHPPLAYASWIKEAQSGLIDRDHFLEVLEEGLDGRDATILAGHWHKRLRIRLDLPGHVELLVASSASHLGGSERRVAAYHAIHFTENDDGAVRVGEMEIRGFDPSRGQMMTLAKDDRR